MDISTQQCDAAWETMAELKKQIASQDVVSEIPHLHPIHLNSNRIHLVHIFYKSRKKSSSFSTLDRSSNV
jgi:hypothetical protein